MNKVKNFGLIVLAVFVLILAWQVNRYTKRYNEMKSNADRLFQNNLQLTSNNRELQSLNYTKAEFLKIANDSIKVLLKKMSVPIKVVTKIVEKTVTVNDTVIKEVPVYLVAKNEWKISDRDKCWTWQGIAKLTDDSLSVKRTAFTYQNKTTDVYHRKMKGKFLFFRIYSRKEIEMNSVSECGDSFTKIINVTKK